MAGEPEDIGPHLRRGILDSDLNFIYLECRKLVKGVPYEEVLKLAYDRANRLGHGLGDPEESAAMAIFQMSRDWELTVPVPEWAGKELREAVEKAKELRESLEVSRKMRERDDGTSM